MIGVLRHAVYLHQLLYLLFHPFYTIYHQYDTVHGSKGKVGFFSKIFMPALGCLMMAYVLLFSICFF